MQTKKISAAIDCLLPVLILVLVGGCSRGDESSTTKNNSSASQPKTITFSPRIRMESKDGGEPKPVMELETVDESGQKKMVQVPIDNTSDLSQKMQFSVTFGTPAPDSQAGTKNFAP